MWPFKKKPEPPCGEKNVHYKLEEQLGMGCPVCYAMKEDQAREAELDQLAKRIVFHLCNAVEQAAP